MTRRADPVRGAIAALEARLGDALRVDSCDAEPWCSATFAGTRLRLAFTLSGPDADRLLDGIEDAEIPLPGHFVADLAIDDIVRSKDEKGRTTVTCTVTLLALEAD